MSHKITHRTILSSNLTLLGFFLFATTLPIAGQTVDFESPAYLTGKTVVGIDGWTRNESPKMGNGDAFTIQSSPENKWLQADLAAPSSLARVFGERPGRLDLRWRWRASGDKVNLCLGVAGNTGGLGLGLRASTCLDAEGLFQADGIKPILTNESWVQDKWYYMHMFLYPETNYFILYFSTDSLRLTEHEIIPYSEMNGVGPITALKLWSGSGNGKIEIDDITWESFAFWTGESDSAWSKEKNWSSGRVPDSLTNIGFSTTSSQKCFIDKNVMVKSITFFNSWSGILNLGKSTLSVLGKADFTGASFSFQSSGLIRFSSQRGQSITGPDGDRNLPPLRHDGSGCLRLDTRTLNATRFLQTQGKLDFNGQDLKTAEDFFIKNGTALSLLNLEGRTLSIGKTARFEGLSKDTLLNLVSSRVTSALLPEPGPPAGWNLIFANPDTLVARNVILGNSRVTGTTGYAFQSTDNGNNSGWVFVAPPAILKSPENQILKPGDQAVFRVSISSNIPVTLQWLRNDLEISGAKDSVYTPGAIKLADNGSTFSCKVSSASGSTRSTSALLQVIFPEPAPTPGPQGFIENLVVSLTPKIAGATTFFSLNGGPFKEYRENLVLQDSTTLKAFSVFLGDTSAMGSWTFPKRLVPQVETPIILPNILSFIDSQVITMETVTAGSLIYYTLDQSVPDTVITASTSLYRGQITLRQTTTVRARAVKSGYQSSDIRTVIYAKKNTDTTLTLDQPRANPPGGFFVDSQAITILAPPTALDATLFFQIGNATFQKYTEPIIIRSSSTLRLLASKGQKFSDTVTYNFTNQLSAPSALPKTQTFSDTLSVSLSSKISGATIRYTLDGSNPGMTSSIYLGTPLLFRSSAILKAIAIKGNDISSITTYSYTLVAKTLEAGKKFEISNTYSLTSLQSSASPVTVEIIRTDSMLTLKGFRDIQFAVRLALPEASKTFPNILFTAPQGEKRGLYALEASGSIRHLSEDDSYEFLKPGTYFLGLDTLAPQITLSGESFGSGDSTKVTLTIQDNINNLLLNLERSDNPKINISNRTISSPEIVTFMFRNPPGSIQPLFFRVLVDDHHQIATFPAESGAYHFLAQKNSSPIQTPPLFKIGTAANNRWDLVTLPLEVTPPITLTQLRKNNQAPGLIGATWDVNTNAYRLFKDEETFTPGMAIWLAAPTNISSMVFPSLQTNPRLESGTYKMTLHKGWNQVANPTLSTLYWPITRDLPEIYDRSALKGLHGYTASTQQYSHENILVPWRGYFAYYKGNRDTTIEMSFKPIAPISGTLPRAKQSSNQTLISLENPAVSLSLILSNQPALRLGASVQAINGIGLEDESRPPPQKKNAMQLWSLRETSHLETDILHWAPGEIMTWKIVAQYSLESNLQTEGLEMVSRVVLPEGYCAWAVSRKRGIRFPLIDGISTPMVPGLVDSLDILAGPTGLIESQLAAIPKKVDAMQFGYTLQSHTLVLHLKLPQPVQVQWMLSSAQGRLFSLAQRTFAEGIYAINPNPTTTPLAPGAYYLKLTWSSQAANSSLPQKGQWTRKIVLP